MKVLHINSFVNGGAARACFRLHSGLLRAGVDSKVMTLESSGTKGSVQYGNNMHIWNKIMFHLQYRLNGLSLRGRSNKWEMFSFPSSVYKIKDTKEYKEADIINLHWTAFFLNWKDFFKDNQKKIVWTLHDMNPFTGGCHYAGSCRKYLAGCDTCPQLSRTIDQTVSAKIFNEKLNALRNIKNMTIVSPSNWLSKIAKRSKLLGRFDHVAIPNSVDTNIFFNRPREEARKKLDLPRDKQILLFVSDSVDNYRKGYSLLVKALQGIDTSNLVLLAVGTEPKIKPEDLPILYFGKVTDEQKMSLVYAAADFFVIPSLEDNLPNTVIESLACGTPVVGFPVGGIVDMIRADENGWLAKGLTAIELASAIEIALKTYRNFYRDKIRREAVKHYDLGVQAKKYLKIYKSL